MNTIKNSSNSKMITIALTQMWESFSFFGMRALLVLYLISGAGYTATDAVILYTLYIALVKLLSGAGGYISDRLLGYKQAVFIGGALITTGHLLLAFSPYFYISLGCIVAGSSIFRVSLQAMLGLSYSKDDPKRDRGFTFFYVGMNLGGLLAAILCGFVAEIYGWHAGFGLAALGMVLGMVFFLLQSHQFVYEKKSPILVSLPIGFLSAGLVALILSYFTTVQFLALPLGVIAITLILIKMGRKIALSIGMAIFFLIAFSTAEELWGSLLMLFSENHINRFILGIEIPSAAIAATNPLTIILLGPYLARKELRYEIKLILGFLALAMAFLILYITSERSNPSVLYLIIGLASIAIGELFLVPTILSEVSKIAPENRSGEMMGLTIIALSIGSLLSGKVATFSYGPVFLTITFLALFISATLLIKDTTIKKVAS